MEFTKVKLSVTKKGYKKKKKMKGDWSQAIKISI